MDKAEAPVGPVDMNCVIKGVLGRLDFMIKEYKAQIESAAVWPGVIGFAPWIEEVWANYISNAIKYGGRPPHVELGVSLLPDGIVRFWTLDNGQGIPPKVRGRLFTPYSQVECIRNTGHGLGLSIVASIIEKMGGQVGVDSELGKGSLFFFTLPASPASP